MLNIDNIFVTNMALHTAVTQAEVTFVDAIKITYTITKWCFLYMIVF